MSEHKLIVDPGFVHHRKIQTILQEQGTEIINSQIAKIPASVPEWQKPVHIDHIYTRVLLQFCKINEINTLEQIVLERRGRLFCSIVKLKPCKELYSEQRAVLEAEPFEGSDLTVEFHITCSRVTGDTLRSHLSDGGEFAIVAEHFSLDGKRLIFHPLIIGFPYLEDVDKGNLSWTKYSDFYRLHIEDFDEFSKVKKFDIPAGFDVMKQIKESVFKAALGKILKESTPKDWGGESSDFVTSHLHLNGKRVSAAFLLKGPAKYSPMTMNNLGKNGDQIVRLAHEPTEILVVQHSHDITSAVIETLKLFATQPSNPRFFCLVDGRESLRLLNAYGLTEWAINKSKNG